MTAINAAFGDIGLLAAQHATPLVVYSEARLLDNIAALTAALPAPAKLAWSIKANPAPALLRLITRNGLMAEAASAGELRMALRNGVAGDRLLLGGPAKSAAALETALTARAAFIVVESATDLARLRAVARRSGCVADALVRVNPAQPVSEPALPMAGIASPFGVDEAQLPALLETFGNDGVRYAGLHLYAGSQQHRADDIVRNARYLCDLALRLGAAGHPLPRALDFGGGFGVPDDAGQAELDMRRLGTGLETLYREQVAELTRGGLETTLFESGRYLASRAGIYVARVLDVKRSQGRRFVILDGGINHLGIRQLQYRTAEPRLSVWQRDAPADAEPATLVGPTCAPIDVVHRACRLADVTPGDLVIMSDFGAYTVTFAPLYFCGHPWPAEVLVARDGAVQQLRRRGSLDEACGPGWCDAAD